MAVNISKMEKARTFYCLSQSDSLRQAEVIAAHYASLANMAMQLKQMVEVRKVVLPNPLIDKMIAYLTDKIKEQHVLAFGIELNWNTKGEEE